MTNVMLDSSDGEKGDSLLVVTVLIMFGISVRGSIERKEYAFLLNIEMKRPIDKVDKTLRCVYITWGTDDELDHILRQNTGIFKQWSVNAAEWFEIERLKTSLHSMIVLRAKQAIASFLKGFRGQCDIPI